MITPELEKRIFTAMKQPTQPTTRLVTPMDDSGRIVGEPQLMDFFERQPGPWDANGTGKKLTVVCSWCPESGKAHDAAIARGELVTHTICPSCLKRMESEL